MLSDSEEPSDTESFHKLTVNEHYAKAFQYKKEREELQKLKEKYGSDFDEDEDDLEADSESDESEDEDGEELTPNVDAAILRTLARIKRRDPQIYDANKNIFVEQESKSGSLAKHPRAPKDKSKPVTLRQVALQSALNPASRSPSPAPLPHVEEQRALRDETIAAFHQTLAPDEEEDFLVLRERNKDDVELEEEEYRTFLEREVGEDIRALVDDGEEVVEESVPTRDEKEGKAEKEKEKKKKKKKETGQAAQKSNEESDQDFLMNYILNRGWIDRSAKRIPTYGEVTSTKSKDKKRAPADATLEIEAEEEQELPTADPDLDEEDFEEIVDRFESSYNFRFEEPDAAVIKAYPRQMTSLVRREDTKRKDARERKKQRKEEQVQQKKEEIKRLKNLKMKEIKFKLERIGKEGGRDLEDEALQALDLDGDWDPGAHDRQMADLYGVDEDFDNDEKPTWDDDIDIGHIEGIQAPTTKEKKKKKKKKKGGEDEEAAGVDVDAMDADVEKPFDDDEEWDGTEEMRKRKLNEYMDEVYGLDFNDMIGDMPTRFKYVPVAPQTYHLTAAEILMATDQELNEYMGVKKYAPYRKEVKWDSKRNERLKEFKQKLAQRTSGTPNTEDGSAGAQTGPVKKKRMGKKERLKLKAAAEDGEEGGEEANGSPAATSQLEVQTQKRKRDAVEVDTVTGAAQSSGKKKRRRKHKDKEGTIET